MFEPRPAGELTKGLRYQDRMTPEVATCRSELDYGGLARQASVMTGPNLSPRAYGA